MAYIPRGRGPRTRGGSFGGRGLGTFRSMYTRSDGNIFSCLADHAQDGDGNEINSSDNEDIQADIDTSKSDSTFGEVRYQRQEKKRKFNSSSGDDSKLLQTTIEGELADYQSLPNDEKLLLILTKVCVNENRFKHLENMLDNVVKQRGHISKIESVVKSYEDRIRLLEYKSIDLEARSRRNNLLFYGLAENRNEDCKDIMCQFILDQLEIRVEESELSRVHQIGAFKGKDSPRPIIVAFREYTLTERITKMGHLLKDTHFSVSRDHPIEITRGRKTLWSDYKQVKSHNPFAKATILYPAKLMINGKIVKDLFPEWNSIIRGSRMDMRHPSQQYKQQQTGLPNVPSVGTQAIQSTPDVVFMRTDVNNVRDIDMEVSNQNNDTQLPGVEEPDPHSVSQSLSEPSSAERDHEERDDRNPAGAGTRNKDESTFKTPQPSSSNQEEKTKSAVPPRARSRSRSRSISRARSVQRPSETPRSSRTDDTA